MFRVASSLDSMVVGEAQILGQVKQSWSVARELGAVKGPLDKLLQGAFSAAKRVRTETEIGSSSVSIASVGVDLARRNFWIARRQEGSDCRRRQDERAGGAAPDAARGGFDYGGEPHLRARGAAGGAVPGAGDPGSRSCMRGRTRRTSLLRRTGSAGQILGVEQAQEILTGGRTGRCS